MVRFCPNCWREIPDGLEDCPQCGRLPDTDDLVGKYIAALRHRERTRASLAIQVLSEFMHERRAIPALIHLAANAEDAGVAAQAVQALGEFADPQAVPTLRQLLLCGSTPLIVRTAAVTALASIGSQEAIATLLRAATDDPSPSVRDRAQRAIGACATSSP